MYTISREKIQQVVETQDGKKFKLTAEEVREFCVADWAEGDEHQAWLDSATPDEIADWVIAGRSEDAKTMTVAELYKNWHQVHSPTIDGREFVGIEYVYADRVRGYPECYRVWFDDDIEPKFMDLEPTYQIGATPGIKDESYDYTQDDDYVDPEQAAEWISTARPRELNGGAS